MGTLYYKMQNGTVVPVGGNSLPSAWTALPLQAPASVYGGTYAVPSYRKNGDIVELRGLVALAGTAAQYTVIGALPAGFRPSGYIRFSVAAHNSVGDITGQLEILSNGNLSLNQAMTVYVFLDGVQFSTL